MKKYCLLVLTLCFSSILHAGIQTNGGDAIAAEFLAIFDDLSYEFSHLDLNSDGVDGSHILTAMNEKRAYVELRSAPELSLNDVPKDAINYPGLNPPLIEISQNSWKRLSRVQKAQLVLHEMLPIAGYMDRDYKLSSRFINKTYLGEDRNGEIKKIFERCDQSNLQNIKIFELIRILDQRQIMLPQITAKGLCVEGLRLLIQAQWDLNICPVGNTETLELTTFAYISAFFPRGFRQNFRNIDEFEKLLTSNGATRTCSGYYVN